MGLSVTPKLILCTGPGKSRVVTTQGKQGIWVLIFPDRKNTENVAKNVKKGTYFQHLETFQKLSFYDLL